MKWIITSLLLLGICVARADRAPKRIVLIGNAASRNALPLLDAVRKTVKMDSNTIVLFLGDNVLDRGDFASLDRQMNVVNGTKAKAIFLPGKNEWAKGEEEGYESVKEITQYIKGKKEKNLMVAPENGCPGPEEIEVGNDVILLIMDTQWWLHAGYKPDAESDCKYKTRFEILDEIEDILQDNREKLIIVATHHPLRSTGIHSNYFDLKQHIFPFTDIRKMEKFYLPLPLIGSLYPMSRNVFFGRQDAIYPNFLAMQYYSDELMDRHHHLLYVAGREHILEALKHDDNHYLVSGAGHLADRAAKTKEVNYRERKTGFAVLDITADKNVNTTFYEVENGNVKESYNAHLLSFAEGKYVTDDTATLKNILGKQDSMVVAPNKKFDDVAGYRKFLFGHNYREEWGTPVKLKVFDLKTQDGGYTIDKLGGGRQSYSLHLRDKNGKRWALRTVNKDITQVLPFFLRQSLANDVMQDMMSSAHPYGAVMVPDLMQALKLPHPTPRLFFAPNDPAFGFYRPAFANKVVMLEEMEPTWHGEKVRNTMEVFGKTLDENDQSADQKSFLKARMLDFMISDFDRHYEQWKWGTNDTGIGRVYYAVPRDRDQAYYNSDGLLPSLAVWRRFIALRGFKPKMKKPEWLGFYARDIDRFFLNDLSRSDWESTIAEVESSITDDVITKAVHRLPKEVYPIRGEYMENTLKTRRDILYKSAGMEYYRFLARNPIVVGTNESDKFEVSGVGDKVLVEIKARNKQGTKEWTKYSRLFDPHETKEVRLYGLNGDDRINIDQSTPHGIRFRIIGGAGNDTFDLRGNARKLIYDRSDEPNTKLVLNNTVNMMSNNPRINQFVFREPTYNSVLIPQLNGGYNVEDGLFLGLLFLKKTVGFRNDPATEQRFGFLAAFGNSAYQLNYKGIFNHVFGNFDIVAEADFKNPALNNFFGFGNETVLAPGQDFRFYRVRYSYLSADVLLRKRFAKVLSFSAGPMVYYYWNKPTRLNENVGKVLQFPSQVGLDSAEVYTRTTYAGGKVRFDVNSVFTEMLPIRGIDAKAEFTALSALNDVQSPYYSLESSVALYSELSRPAKLVSALRFGGGHIFSKEFEYFQAMTLGANNYLRGFRKNRFAGRSMVYGSLEMRLKLFKWYNYIAPGDVGILGFGDIGRVWMPGETSHLWHPSGGGGIYYTPFNLMMLSVIAGFSDEESFLINGSIGAKINLTY